LLVHDLILTAQPAFFPIGTYRNKIADAVMGMYASKGEQHEDLIFDDKAVLVSSRDEKGKNPAETIDTLIEDKPPKK